MPVPSRSRAKRQEASWPFDRHTCKSELDATAVTPVSQNVAPPHQKQKRQTRGKPTAGSVASVLPGSWEVVAKDGPVLLLVVTRSSFCSLTRTGNPRPESPKWARPKANSGRSRTRTSERHTTTNSNSRTLGNQDNVLLAELAASRARRAQYKRPARQRGCPECVRLPG